MWKLSSSFNSNIDLWDTEDVSSTTVLRGWPDMVYVDLFQVIYRTI